MCLALQALFPVQSSNKDWGTDKDRDKFIWDDLEPNEAVWTRPANRKNFLTGWARLRVADAVVAAINKADPDTLDTVVALNKRDSVLDGAKKRGSKGVHDRAGDYDDKEAEDDPEDCCFTIE